MTGMMEQRSKLKFATKLLPNCFWGARYVVELIGGPDRDRTDDLFHAMEARSQLRHRPTDLLLSLSLESGASVNPRDCRVVGQFEICALANDLRGYGHSSAERREHCSPHMGSGVLCHVPCFLHIINLYFVHRGGDSSNSGS